MQDVPSTDVSRVLLDHVDRGRMEGDGPRAVRDNVSICRAGHGDTVRPYMLCINRGIEGVTRCNGQNDDAV